MAVKAKGMEDKRSPEDWKSIIDKKTHASDLDTRWQTDEDLYLMKEYSWPTDKGTIVESRDEVTLNSPRYFADRVIDTIKFSSQIIEIENDKEGNKIVDKQATPIEDFLRINFELADERLDRAEMLPNKAAAAGHFTIRGRAMRRVLVYTKGGDYVPDIQWYDPRYVKYAPSKDGLLWAAPIMNRSAEDIYSEYGVEVKGQEAEVIDLWTPQWEHVWVGGKLINERSWNHKLGYVPFVGQIVPIGGFIQTKGEYEQAKGESVYAAVRDLYEVLNKLMTIEMTYSRLAIEGAYQYEAADPQSAKAQVAKNKYPVEPGKVTVVEKGGGYQLIPIGDIKAATQHLISTIEVSIQRATLPFLDYGQTPFELSGSAMLMVKGAGDIIYIPRLAALELMDKHTAWMLIDQYRNGGLKVELGEGPYKHKYTKKDLSGEYAIKYKYVPNLPEKDLARLHLAASVKELGVSLDTIHRDYLELTDPDGERRKMLKERFENETAAAWLPDALEAEIAAGRKAAADIAELLLNVNVDQLMNMNVAGAEGMEQPKPNTANSALFPTHRGRGGNNAQVREPQMPVKPQDKEVLA